MTRKRGRGPRELTVTTDVWCTGENAPWENGCRRQKPSAGEESLDDLGPQSDAHKAAGVRMELLNGCKGADDEAEFEIGRTRQSSEEDQKRRAERAPPGHRHCDLYL